MDKNKKDLIETESSITETSTSDLIKRSQKDLRSYRESAESLQRAVEALNRKNYDEAILHFQNAIRQNRESAEAHFYLGLTYFMIGEHENAEIAYKTAIDCEPNDPLIYLNLGIVCQLRDRSREAISAYKMAIALEPQNPEPYARLGTLLSDLGDRDEARTAIRKAIELKLLNYSTDQKFNSRQDQDYQNDR